ncbi:hypothetical protein [Streptomyces sp. NPDC051183]|uniref:hypothetical protein n=1 Tax=unclassified Streptomyces TaxID=2593676 RepID=UPI00343FFC51
MEGIDAGRMVSAPIACRYCGWDRFQVALDECFCEGCCLALGIQDGDVYPGAPEWELVPSDALTPADTVGCPAEHDVFHVAVTFTFAPDGRVRSLSVGLRCPVDGERRLLIDNARVVPRVR